MAPRVNQDGTRIYKRRWWMMFMFIIFCTVNASQWSEYTVIEDVIVDYYQINSSYVEWTANCYAFILTFFIVPWVYLLEKFGLKPILVVTGWVNAIGAVVKVFSTERDSFMTIFIGNWIVAIAQLGYLPGRLAAVWFGAHEVSTACALGVIGNQLGVALGFLLPPLIVKKNEDKSITKSQLNVLNIILAAASVGIALLMHLTLQERPLLPPSKAAKEQRKEEVDFCGTIRRLSKNKGYLLLMVLLSIVMGVFCAIAVLLNRIVLTHFPDAGTDVGMIGLMSVISGGVGTMAIGILLDKFGHYKEISVVTFLLAALSSLGMAFVVDKGNILWFYITSSLLGLFLTSYFTVSFELAAELTYPENEGTSTGILNGVPQIMAIPFTIFGSWVIKNAGVIKCLYFYAFLLVIGAALASFVPKNYKRQAMKTMKAPSDGPELKPLKQNGNETA